MASWNNDGFRNQKKRSFIYKSTGQNRVPAINALNVDHHLTGPSVTNIASFSSPRKKMKSSYSFYDKSRSDQEAAEELCSGLPDDAFEDDIGDDFGDDLTAEQLCEAASVAEMAAHCVKQEGNSMNESIISEVFVDQASDVIKEEFFEDLPLDQDGDEVASVSRKQNNFHIPVTSTETFRSENDVTKCESLAHETTAFLFSSTSEYSNTCKNTSANKRTMHVNDVFVDGKSDKSMEQLQLLKSNLKKSEEKIKMLEEEKYGKDGELKILQDSLAHFQAEDQKKRNKIRLLEEEKVRKIEENEKEHKKHIEQLKTQLYFKDQEIAQAKEQLKKQMQIPNESVHGSPQRKEKSLKNFENSLIPTGRSFFEKNPSDSKLSPKNKNAKFQRSPGKLKQESTNSVCENSLFSESLEPEKRSVKKKRQLSEGAENDLLQKLLKLENTEIGSMCSEYQGWPINQSLLPLLNLNSKVVPLENSKREDDLEVQNLKLMAKQQTPKKKSDLALDTEINDNTLLQSVYESIQELLISYKSSHSSHESYLDLVSNIKVSNFLDSCQRIESVVGLLQLLEHHITVYVELRIDNDENSLSSTCSPSSPGDSSELRQPLDKDGAVALSQALDAAVESLRCLNILVLCSDDVCEVLLRSNKLALNDKKETKEAIANCHVSESNNSNSDILNLVLKLTVPLPNELSLVTQVALRVITSLAQKCLPDYRDRFFPLLCGTVLPQCLSRDCSLSVLSLVVPILMVIASIPNLMKHLCSQSDECLLLKVYQGCLGETDDLPHPYKIRMQVITLVETILSSKNEAIPLLLDSECHCSLELIKCLVLLLHKEMVFIQCFPMETIKLRDDTSDSFLLLRRGVFLLANLVTNSSRLLADLHLEVEQQYNNLIIGTAQLYSAIKDIPEGEVLALQDMLDFEQIDVDVETDDMEEDMDVDT